MFEVGVDRNSEEVHSFRFFLVLISLPLQFSLQFSYEILCSRNRRIVGRVVRGESDTTLKQSPFFEVWFVFA